MNTHLHLAGAWIGYLRGPNLGNWTRAAHGVLTAFDAASDVRGIAADEATEDGATACYRYAILGLVTAASAIRVSRRGIGSGWVSRAIPASVTGTLRGIAFVGRWLTWSATAGELWSTIADDLSGNSAIGTNDATKWAGVSSAGKITKAAAWCAGVTGRAAGARHAVVFTEPVVTSTTELLVSVNDGSSWASVSYAWGANANTTGGAYDATRDQFFVVSGRGAVAASSSGAPTSAWATAGSFAGLVSTASPSFQLVLSLVAGGGTLLAWATHDASPAALASTFMVRSTDGGATWEQISAPDDITHVAYADGAWIASCSAAPYLYESHDDGDSWQRTALPVGEEAEWSLARVVYADGQVLATGVDFCVASGRAMATEDGTLVPDTTPSVLSDAYRLRGRLIYDVAPSDGDVYSWNAATSRWEPVAASSLSVTTTRGDLIRRGASADERLALGTQGYVLRAGATDPGWGVVSASDSALPAAGADYAGATYWNTATGGYYVCIYGGATPAWGWRLLDAHEGTLETDQTTDAAWTTIATETLPADVASLLDIEVAGIKSDRTAAVVARGSAGYVNDGAALTVIEALTLLVGDPLRVQLVESGLDVSVQVKGVVAETWTWRAKITRRLEVEP